MAFYHQRCIGKDTHVHDGTEYEIRVYRADEDGHLRVYVWTGTNSNLFLGTEIGEMTGEVASDMKHVRFDNPVDFLIARVKEEIDAGRVHLE